MASLMLHLVVAEQYYKYNELTEKMEFLKGNLAPDLCEYKEAGHFVEDKPYKTYVESIKERVDLKKFCSKVSLDSDFNKGYFFHLVVDYVFYKLYLPTLKAYTLLDEMEYDKAISLVYDEYGRMGYIIAKNFGVKNISILPTFAQVQDNDKLQLFDECGVVHVIKQCSKLDIEESYEKVKEGVFDRYIKEKIGEIQK